MGRMIAEPGKVLRSLRLQRGLTLAEVSERTSLPISTLSKIENGRMSLSYEKLARISTGLSVDISILFSHQPTEEPIAGPTTARRSVTRAGEGHAIDTEAYHQLFPASDLLRKRFVPIVAEIKARSVEEFGEFIRHAGEEYTFVLEGVVVLHTDHYAPISLETGDSIYFDSGMGHAYIAGDDRPCRVLTICSGDESQLAPSVQLVRAPVVSAARSPTVRPAARRLRNIA